MSRTKGSVDKILGGRKGRPLYFKVNNPRRAYGRPEGAIGKGKSNIARGQCRLR